jgi:hypothetical protein
MLVAFTASTLKTEEVYESETSVHFYHNIRRHVQEHSLELSDDMAQKAALFTAAYRGV